MRKIASCRSNGWVLATDTSERLHVFQLNQKGNGGGFTQVQILRAAPPCQLGNIKTATFVRQQTGCCDSALVTLCCGSAMWTVTVSGGESVATLKQEVDDQVQWVEWLRSSRGVELPIACIAGRIHRWDTQPPLRVDQWELSELELTALQSADEECRCIAASGAQIAIKCNNSLAILSCGRGSCLSVELVDCDQAPPVQMVGFEASVGWIGWSHERLELWGAHGALLQSLEGFTQAVVHMGAKHTVVANGPKALLCVSLGRDEVAQQKDRKPRKQKSGVKALKDR